METYFPVIHTVPVPVTVQPQTRRAVSNPLPAGTKLRAEIDGMLIEGVVSDHQSDSPSLHIQKTVWRNQHAIGTLSFYLDLDRLPWKITILDSHLDFATKNC